MGVFDKITKLKIDKELAYDKKVADDLERAMMENVRDIADAYKDENRPKPEDFKAPEPPDVEMSGYKEKTEKELLGEALKKTGKKDAAVFTDEEARGEQDKRVREQRGVFEKNLAESDEALARAEREIRSYAVKKGLSDSSIADLLAKRAREDAAASKRSAREEYISKLKAVGEKLEDIGAREEEKRRAADEAYEETLDKALQSVRSEENRKKSAAEKNDAAALKAKTDYEKAVKSAENAYKKALEDYDLKKADAEKKFGYDDVKKENFDRRLKAAEDFYLSLPKNEALRRALSNHLLEARLGDNYAELIRKIRKEG